VLLNNVLRSEIYPGQSTRVGKKKCRTKLNIVRSDYRNYPLVSNNVGIDFTELGPPHGSTPGGTTQVAQKGQGGSVEKQEDLVVIGFRFKSGIIHYLFERRPLFFHMA
jgi:hypothetical protein